MLCYRDITFCPFHDTCKVGSICGRAYTDTVKKLAEEWLKNPPVALYGEKPPCWEEKQ